MAGGLIELVAYGAQDLYLVDDPQITYFKIMYKRHTNFSIEAIPQFFNTKANFGETVTATIGKTGDLVTKIYVNVILPTIPEFVDPCTGEVDNTKKFAWAKKIGFGLIKEVYIEMGGQVIDRHYGDWLNIWSELTVTENRRGLDKMIGNVPELTELTNGKGSYRLNIPLYFWFNRHNGLALPIIALQYTDVKIHIEFSRLEDCIILGPTNAITIQEEVVHFNEFEIMEQRINNVSYLGMFLSHDIVNKRVNYINISGPFQIPNETSTQDYTVKGLDSQGFFTPKVPVGTEAVNSNINISLPAGISFVKACLYVDYVYLDNLERLRFARSNHEYLIDQLEFDGDQVLVSNNVGVKLGFSHPCKELVWRAGFDFINTGPLRDKFNYTNNIQQELGTNLIKRTRLFLNGEERLSQRDGRYFNYVQPWQHHNHAPNEGINLYSFNLDPVSNQPSGSLNFSKIDDTTMELVVDKDISYSKTAKLRVYGLVHNVVRIINGLGGLAFSN